MRTWIGLLVVFALAACAGAGPLPHLGENRARQNMAREIADNAAAYNEAYGQAVSAQILLNILRSRDRLPRYYLAMTGVSDSASYRFAQSAGIGSVPLGGGGTPLGIGSASVQHERDSRPSYAVQPFSAETLTRTAFEPTPAYVFEHYWSSGWPRDLLLLLMVDEIEVADETGHRTLYTNEANTIFDNCVESVQTEGCAFVRTVRSFLQSSAAGSAPMSEGRPVCGLVDAYAPATPVRRAPGEERCQPAFVVGATTMRLKLRSLDDIIYYIGELMRAGGMRARADEPIEAQVTVHAAGLRGGGAGVPLFRIVPEGSARRGHVYAAEATYGEARYYAGPAIGRSCGETAASGVCADNAEEGDRSSSVLSLIAEILALNQSPDAIRAPERFVTN